VCPMHLTLLSLSGSGDVFLTPKKSAEVNSSAKAEKGSEGLTSFGAAARL